MPSASSGSPNGVKLKKPNPFAPRRISSAFTTRLAAVATSVSIPLISAAKLRGIMSRLGAVPQFCEMRSTTGMKMATTAVELIREPRPPTAAISRISRRFSLLPACRSSQSPSRLATPVLTRPSPITNSAAISMIDGSANPASASFMEMMPVNGITTITRSATASIRGRLTTNITIAAVSVSRTRARSRFIDAFHRWEVSYCCRIGKKSLSGSGQSNSFGASEVNPS